MRIEDKIKSDEPYIHEKIMTKIKKDAFKYIKSQAIVELEGIVKQKKHWLEQNKKKIDK